MMGIVLVVISMIMMLMALLMKRPIAASGRKDFGHSFGLSSTAVVALSLRFSFLKINK